VPSLSRNAEGRGIFTGDGATRSCPDRCGAGECEHEDHVLDQPGGEPVSDLEGVLELELELPAAGGVGAEEELPWFAAGSAGADHTVDRGGLPARTVCPRIVWLTETIWPPPRVRRRGPRTTSCWRRSGRGRAAAGRPPSPGATPASAGPDRPQWSFVELVPGVRESVRRLNWRSALYSRLIRRITWSR
jgi:hypothetical protein